MIQRREVDVDAYQTRISELEKELQSARDYLEHWKGREEEMRQMSLDLERERGKLAGGRQVSKKSLKHEDDVKCGKIHMARLTSRVLGAVSKKRNYS